MRKTAIPCPFYMLSALRRMRRGHYVVVAGLSSVSMYLDGMPYLPLLLPFMVQQELISPKVLPQAMSQVGYLALTEKGHRVAQSGEIWWKSLSWQEKVRARVLGR